MFIWTFLLRITHTIISQSSADSSWITLYIYIYTHTHTYINTKKQHIFSHGKHEQSKPRIHLNIYRKFIITNLTPHSFTDYQAAMLQKIQQSTQVGNHNIADKRTSLPSTPHKLGVGSLTMPDSCLPIWNQENTNHDSCYADDLVYKMTPTQNKT